MDVYAHSCVRQMETESPPRFPTEVRYDWTSRNIKTRTTNIRSAHLEEVFFLKSIRNTRRSSYIPAHGLLFAWLCSLRCGAEPRRMLQEKPEDAPFYAQLQMRPSVPPPCLRFIWSNQRISESLLRWFKKNFFLIVHSIKISCSQNADKQIE